MAGDESIIIALCGKGGAGKTSISAIITKILAENKKKKILAIDADPAAGLAFALDFRVRKTVDDIRTAFIAKLEKEKGADKRQMISMLDYELLHALEEKGNLAFLAIGRPETDGCYCQVNEFLRDIIRSVADKFDYVIIDGEAGVEQVNRRVMEKITHLLVVSDASVKGLNVAGAVLDVSKKLIGFKHAGLILNRIKNESEAETANLPEGLKFLGYIPEDDIIRKFDAGGKSFLDIPDCPAFLAVKKSLKNLL